MEFSGKYVQRVINKYNRRHVIAFVQNRAEKRFLGPLSLTLKKSPPQNFGNNCNRLSRDEEFTLFTALHYMKYKLTKTHIKTCQNRYLQIYIALRNRGISANQPLVFNCVKRHLERGINGIDKVQLIERGYASLINAVDGFDPWMGFRFSTYACNSITRGFLSKIPPSRSFVLIDDIDDIGSEHKDEQKDLYLERLKVILNSDNLDTREKEVLKYRFYAKLTLKEVGNMWGFTKERARQIQNKALAKLKESLQKDPILM